MSQTGNASFIQGNQRKRCCYTYWWMAWNTTWACTKCFDVMKSLCECLYHYARIGVSLKWIGEHGQSLLRAIGMPCNRSWRSLEDFFNATGDALWSFVYGSIFWQGIRLGRDDCDLSLSRGLHWYFSNIIYTSSHLLANLITEPIQVKITSHETLQTRPRGYFIIQLSLHNYIICCQNCCLFN